MAYTRVWSESRPNGATVLASDLDSEIQFTRVDLRERVADIFGLSSADFAVDPIAPSVVKLNRVASSKILGGTTDFAIRNAADTTNNLLVSDSGVLTVRAGITVTTGGVVVSGNSTITGTLAVSSTINSQTISAAANFTGSVTVATTLTATTLAGTLSTAAQPNVTSLGTLSSLTLGGLLTTVASATGGAGLRLPHGSAPTTPSNGDIWTTIDGLYVRVNGVTQLLAASGGVAASTLTGTTLASNVTISSLEQVATITTGVWQGTAIADTYLATISTAGKVANSATTATSANTVSAIVARDASGNFSAGTITATFSGNLTGNVTGNASTATALQTARTINGVSFDGTANITVTAAAGTLTGTTLNSSVTASSLTSVGTLTSLQVSDSVTGQPAIINNGLSAGQRVVITGQRGGLDRWHLGVNASDEFILANVANNAANLHVTDAGVLTVRAGLTVSSGTTAVQALTATTGTFATDAGAVQFGAANRATVGAIRGSNNLHWYSRNAANSADLHVIGLNSSNQIDIGASGTAVIFGAGITATTITGTSTLAISGASQHTINSSVSADVVQFMNVAASGYASIIFADEGAVPRVSIGYGNSAVGVVALRGVAFVAAQGGKGLNLYTDSHYTTPALALATTGAATFRAGITATTGTFSGALLTANGQRLGWNGRGYFISNADGVWQLSDEAGTSFNRLQFGGTTSSFPALKRAGAALYAYLADDSGYANFEAAVVTARSGLIAGAGGATVTKWLTATTTWDIGSLSVDTGATTDVTVSGAAVGDLVIVQQENCSAGTALNVYIRGHVQSADTVRLTAFNTGGVTSDPGSFTYRIWVIKF